MKKVFSIFLVLLFSQVAFAQNGDVNGDGSVTSYDITALYNCLLNNDMTHYSTSDINGDGVVTAADVTAVYDLLLGGSGDNPSVGGHEYVDLGLPSGTLWATMNVGANSPEEYGDYFAWGETQPKSVYNLDTYKWCMGSYFTLTKYCSNSYWGYNGFVDNKTELDPEDDASTANWGPQWRMPSLEQIQELLNNCTSQWTTMNGVSGRLFTSNINCATLFLPAAGSRWGSDILYDVGSWGYYWSRSLYSSYPAYAYFLYFSSDGVFWHYWSGNRSGGQSVRAVRVSQN